MNNNDYDFWFWLSVIANICQIQSFEMNVRQTSNDEIMKHLLNQDKVLDDQTNIYLKEIIKQNETIISLLKGGNSSA